MTQLRMGWEVFLPMTIDVGLLYAALILVTKTKLKQINTQGGEID